MDIAFANRSRFLNDCERAIREGRDRLEDGKLLELVFNEGGYPGRITVTIRGDDSEYFGSDWERSDPSRFPARIKAAATALFNCGCRGTYQIVHDDGVLTIARA